MISHVYFEINVGTDDDLPPSYFNRFPILAPYTRMHIDMDSQIHLLEQEAYGSVLRAFKAQSDALTWVYTFLPSHVHVGWSV